MEPVVRIQGIAAPLLRDNVDTDTIIPSRDISSPSREGFGPKAFAPWRYLSPGGPENPEFVLNRAPWREATILIAGRNFGCGSSREMAVWALAQFGLKAIVAASFGAIFRQNCIRNGLVPVELPHEVATALAERAEREAPLQIAVDVAALVLIEPDGKRHRFELDAADHEMLVTGLDAIDRTWQHRAAMEAFEAADRVARPWIWETMK